MKDVLNISFSAAQNETAQIEVIDKNAMVLMTEKKQLAAGTDLQTINVEKLAGRYYILDIKTKEKTWIEKFVRK